MNRLLPALVLTLLSWLGLARPEACASHAQGGDLRYEYIGDQFSPARPNYYKVSCRLFRDCSGIAAPATLTLNCRVGACGTTNSQNFTATMLRQGSTVFGAQYCATLSGYCGSSVDNYEENTYAANVTLAPQQWVLSTSESNRPPLANINGAPDLYFEATLNNLIVGTTQNPTVSLTNSSPTFGMQPTTFVPWLQEAALNMGAFDADGDSLAFSLVSPLAACGTPVSYRSTSGIYPLSGSCFASMQPNQQFSATFPLPSAELTGTCPMQTASPYFAFSASNGMLLFTPIVYTAGQSSQGLNKYALTVKVDEYRRLNGAYQQIGSVRRELFMNVYDCGQNLMPRFADLVQVTGQPAPVALAAPIVVQRGTPVTVTLTATDANAGQQLAFRANQLNVPGITALQTGATTVDVTFAPPATLPDGTYYVPVQAEDNNCPLKGQTVQTLAFRVTGTTLSSRAPGRQLVSTAFPNPFADEVRFTLARPRGAAPAVEVVDQLGRVVERLPVPAGPGPEATLTWRPAPALPAGVYLARFPEAAQTVRLLHLGR